MRRYDPSYFSPTGEEDQTRCIAATMLSGYPGVQCTFRRRKGPGGLYCGLHARMISHGGTPYVPEDFPPRRKQTLRPRNHCRHLSPTGLRCQRWEGHNGPHRKGSIEWTNEDEATAVREQVEKMARWGDEAQSVKRICHHCYAETEHVQPLMGGTLVCDQCFANFQADDEECDRIDEDDDDDDVADDGERRGWP